MAADGTSSSSQSATNRSALSICLRRVSAYVSAKLPRSTTAEASAATGETVSRSGGSTCSATQLWPGGRPTPTQTKGRSRLLTAATKESRVRNFHPRRLRNFQPALTGST